MGAHMHEFVLSHAHLPLQLRPNALPLARLILPFTGLVVCTTPKSAKHLGSATSTTLCSAYWSYSGPIHACCTSTSIAITEMAWRRPFIRQIGL